MNFSKKAVQDICNSGKICVLDVELQGVRNFKKAQFEAKYIFVRPPSMEVLVSFWIERHFLNFIYTGKSLATAWHGNRWFAWEAA